MFYLSGSEVSLNIALLKVSFQSRLSAGLGGQPADHMELLGPTPDHSLNLTSFSFLVFHSTAPLLVIIPLLFLRDFAGAPLNCETALLYFALNKQIQRNS